MWKRKRDREEGVPVKLLTTQGGSPRQKQSCRQHSSSSDSHKLFQYNLQIDFKKKKEKRTKKKKI